MRTGQYQRNPVEARGNQSAQKNAETLFETRTVADLRDVEKRTRQEIDDKKEELRQLVGNSYRDLIESSDKIVEMRDCCESVVSHVGSMQSGFSVLNSRVANFAASVSQTAGSTTRLKLYAAGGRVKYLIDTPEIIWGCLDERQYLKGTERYLRALKIYTLLMDPKQKDLLVSFPLVHYHWPLVETFRTQLVERSHERLRVPSFGTKYCAVALSSIAMIEEMPTAKVLSLFLELRRQLLVQLLQNSSTQADERSVGDLIAIICEFTRILQRTVCEVGELFLQTTPGEPALFISMSSAANDEDQLFGGIPQPEAEINAWKEHRSKLASVISQLETEEVREACQQWLWQIGEEVASHGKQLLAAFGTVSDLAQLEADVRAEIKQETGCGDCTDWITRTLGTTPEKGSCWDAVCQVVIGEAEDLWVRLLDTVFLERAVKLLEAAFDSLEAVSAAEEALQTVQSLRKGEYPLIRAAQGWCRSPVEVQESGVRADMANYSPIAMKVAKDLDAHLGGILADVLRLVDSAEQETSREKRAKHIEPRAQTMCQRVLMQLAAGLDRLLRSVGDDAGKDADSRAAAVEKALFIGRLSLMIGCHSTQLPVLLGPTQAWGAPAEAAKAPHSERAGGKEKKTLAAIRAARGKGRGASAGNGGTPAPEADSELQKVQSALLKVSTTAYATWRDHAATHLKAALEVALIGDELLKVNAPQRSWEETLVRNEGEGDVGEMRLLLPAVPSPYVLKFLFAACQEVHRIGSHTLELETLRAFVGSLATVAVETYSALVGVNAAPGGKPAPGISEKGLLQMLFDVRFLTDAISAGIASSPAERANPVPHQRVAQLEEALQVQLDPIDWATYEPYLWANERRYYQRCAVLLGAFFQLKRVHSGNPGKVASNAETNTLNVAPSVPRFTYLPISTPSSANGASGLSELAGDVSPGATWQSGNGQQVGTFGQSQFGKLGDFGKLKDKSTAAISGFGDMFGVTPFLTSKREG
eukprot:gene1270-1854_t